MSATMTVSQAREEFAELVNRVADDRERVRIVRRGRELVAVVPMADIELPEALDDELDLAAAREGLADPSNDDHLTLQEVRARLGR